MKSESPPQFPHEALSELLISLADDELLLGHRDSEWTGHSPILEEDIAFSNIAQDELGHSLLWYTLNEALTGRSPNSMAFERPWTEFTACRFVTYPKDDFAYTVVRQYLFDAAEEVRLGAFAGSSYASLKEMSGKLLREEAYHVMHSQGLVERLGNATEESHRRMQAAVDSAFPQALGIFESLDREDELVRAGIFPGNSKLRDEWLNVVVPVLSRASLRVPAELRDGRCQVSCTADAGGRRRSHTNDLKELIEDLQAVYRLVPGGKW
jgi:ring-1,2-phenylacetyl-CoA epoxidase subunit PaaC